MRSQTVSGVRHGVSCGIIFDFVNKFIVCDCANGQCAEHKENTMKDLTLILRQLISIFLIAAVFLTSASAYIPKTSARTLFLVNENRELRCRLTSENAGPFSLRKLQNLAQNNALVVASASLTDELRSCDQDDVTYAEIIFSDPVILGALTPRVFLGNVLAVAGLFIIAMKIGSGGAKQRAASEDNPQPKPPQSVLETLKIIAMVCDEDKENYFGGWPF